MNRRSLIKSLFTIAVAPKVLSELNLMTPPKIGATSTLFSDLQLLTPQYANDIALKYGDMNWVELMEKYKHEKGPEMFWFENRSKSLNIEACQNTY